MSDEKLLFAELKAAERLPSQQGVAIKVLELLGQEDTPLEDIAQLIQTDPALSAAWGKLLEGEFPQTTQTA